MADLSGLTIAATFDRLLALPSGGLSGTTLRALTDGNSDTAISLQVATTKTMIEGSGNKLFFGDEGGEYISGNGSALTLNSGSDINLTCASGDVLIPKNIGLVFDDNGSEKIESDNSDLTIASGRDIFLSATNQVVLASMVELEFGGAGSSEYIHGDGTDLYLTSGADINIPSNIGLTFGDDGEKIEGNGTRMSIASGGDMVLDCEGDIEINADGGDIIFKDGSTNALYIDMDTTPGAAYIRNGAANAVIALDDGDRNLYFYDKGGEYIAGDGTDLSLTSGADILLMSTGNVGIGVTDPDKNAYGADYTVLSIAGADVNNISKGGVLEFISLGDDTDDQTVGIITTYVDENVADHKQVARIHLKTNGSTATKFGGRIDFDTKKDNDTALSTIMTIDSTGFIGINDTTPDNRLDVVDNTDSAFVVRIEHTDADNPNGIQVAYSGGAPNTADVDLFFKGEDTGATRFRVAGNGDVENVTGTDIAAISDERMKENIADYTGGLAIVNALKPRTFTWKSDVDRGMTGTRYGFIAQEMQAISDIKNNMGLVRSGKIDDDDPNYDAIMALCTDGVVNKSMMNAQQAILISAIKELTAKVEALENA